MKKFAKVIACFMLVVLATLGFAGCAKKITLEQATAYIDSTSDISGLEKGFELSNTSDGRRIIATFDDEGNVTRMYEKDDNYEMWLNSEYMYVKVTNNESVTKKKMRVDAIPEAYENYYNKKNNMAGYKASGTKEQVKEVLSEYVRLCEENETAYSLKKDKAFKTTKIKFSTTADEETVIATYEFNFTYKNNKFVGYSFMVIVKNKTTKEKIKEGTEIKAFSGKISMPKDAANYEDVSITE